VAQSTSLQNLKTVSSNLTRTSKAFADALQSIGVAKAQLKIAISFGVEGAFTDGLTYQLDRLTRITQAQQYPKNWLLIKVPGYSEPSSHSSVG
jgi:hypothetical protein